MKLSKLQKYILVNSNNGRKINRKKFGKFYSGENKAKAKVKDVTKIITRSLERLIDKGLMVGLGERTQFKWFIKEIQLTRKGKKLARKLLGEQQTLPFKKKN
jgi:hypothetical protein